MELIWLKPTALMLCTESVWFWSSKPFAGNLYLSLVLQGGKIALDTDPAKSCEIEPIWLKPTARSPALMLCTESVWFWSSEQFTERAALGNFYLSFGLQDLKIVLDKDPAKSCEMESIWLKLTARFPALVLCTESVWFWSSLQFEERAALGNSYMPFGFQSEKNDPVRVASKRWNMEMI